MKAYQAYKDSGISWIGQIPQHWEVLRGKHMFIRMMRDVQESDEVITCFRDGEVTLRRNRRTEGFTESFKEIGYQGIRKGDLVIHQMDAFAGAIGVSDSDGKGTPVYICLQPHGEYLNQYYAYLLREMARGGYIKALYRGIRERSSDFRYETFATQYLAAPPFSEQEAIVRYLEEKTAKIDCFVTKKEEQILRLKELSEAIIAQAVTRGIQPDVALRPSGIPWLGDIPKHWEVKRLSQVSKEYFVSNKNIKHQNLLSLSYGRIVQKDINTTEGLLPSSYDSYQVIRQGNIVLRLTDLQNDQTSLRVGLCTQEGIITSAYLSLLPSNTIIPDYLYYELHTADIKKVFYGMGSGLRQNLNWSELRRLSLPLPSLSEQEAIVAYITEKTEQIDQLIESYRQEIERVKELKQGLISDAVLGRINVQTE